ncbi:hypothetical protein [Nocardiopsis lambiniae]|uniref:DUF3592 domain-containing protein n=1 Tax=Nocardiopsis lambiniae TaxID=3075539 RepID=A0ABU2MDM2_9ACTN|nr:hypothetical protein [Nocardiopsis sp. DSM 44743]MDT0330769.1 hypothetical protein [Nocardiopsis sp. DSM 44743]
MRHPEQAHVDLLERLMPEHRVGKNDKPMSGCGFLLLVLPLAVVLGLVHGLGLAAATEAHLKRAAFTAEGLLVEATVLEVSSGRIMVDFETDAGERLITWADGHHRPDPDRTVEVLHLPDAPWVAQTVDHETWPGWPLVLTAPLLLLGVFALHHRNGLRAGWFVRRFRVHVQGPPQPPRPLAPLLTIAVVLAAVAMVPVAVVAFTDRTAVITAQTSFLLVPVPALSACALIAAVRAALRYAEDRPVRRFPRPFRLLPPGTARGLLAALMAALTVSLFLLGGSATAPDALREPVAGTAEVADVRAAEGGTFVRLRYEVDGIVHEQEVRVGEAALERLLTRDTVPVEWEADDPARVRLRGGTE